MKAGVAKLLIVLLLGIGSGAAKAQVATPAADASASDPSHQVLVMLHLPAPHFRPGAGYGGTYADRPGQGARHRNAEELAHDYGLTLISDWPMPDLGVDCYVMRVPAEASVAELVQRMSQDKRAEWVQAMNVFHALARTDSLQALQPSVRLWHLDELHKVSTGRGVNVAIVDSGVDVAHPDLAGRVAVTRNFVDARSNVAESHGTAIASIIGARADDGARIVGIAPQATLMALRACWEATPEQTLCSSFTLAKALQFAIQNDADVINLSLAGPEDKLLARLLDVAVEHDSTIVGAVDARLPGGGFPASHAGVLAVSDNASRQSSETPRFEPALLQRVLLAPGADVPSAAPGAQWNFVTGASFAAAQVAGLVALVRELVPSMSMRQSAAWTRLTKDSSDGPAGAIDACATLQRAAPALRCTRTTDQTAHASW